LFYLNTFTSTDRIVSGEAFTLLKICTLMVNATIKLLKPMTENDCELGGIHGFELWLSYQRTAI